MAYISEEEIKAIRQQANIVDIISSYLNVEAKGKNYVAICPFHDDHSPSLIISPEKQIFNCFTCRTGGNVFSFVMKYENVSFLEALKIVADKCGYNLKIAQGAEVSPEFKEDYAIMNLAQKYFINNMNTEASLEAKKYLTERGITDEIVKEFGLGLALPEKDTLHQLLTSKKYSLEQQENLGLINKNGLDVYDTFSNRIMIPIENLNGQIVGFTGRIFHNENTAKYLNTKETRIFKKSHILFNYFRAKEAIKKEKEVIIVEGNMDAIRVSASGIKNVIALMGVALSEEQIKFLKKLRVPLILCLDNDNAGLDATLKLGDILLNNDFLVKVIRLSGAKDPDEYIKKYGSDAFLNNVKDAPTFLDFKIAYLKGTKNLNNITDLVAFVKEVINSLKNADDLTKELIISKISKDYEIEADILKKELTSNSVIVKQTIINQEEKKKKNKYDNVAGKILYGMMDNPDFIPIYKNRLGFFATKEERIIASEIVYYNNKYKDINIADFTSYIMNNEEVGPMALEIINDNMGLTLNEEEFNKYIDVFLKELQKKEIQELKIKIKQEMDVNKKVELLERLTEIKKGSVE